MNRFPSTHRSLVGWTFPTILKSENARLKLYLLNLHLGTHEIWTCPISLTMPSLRTLDPVDLAKGNCRWEPAAKTGGLPGDHLSTCCRCWCPLSNQKKTVTGMIRFGLPTLITWYHLHWSAEFVRRNPLTFFCGAAGYSVRWIFSPKKIVHHIPLGISSAGESILAREFPGEFMNYHDYFCLPHGQPQNLRWRPGGGFHMRGSDCRRCDRA